jgi:hypothetical protein
MAIIKERELQTTLEKTRYYINENRQQSRNIEFYLNDLNSIYKTKNSHKLLKIIDELKNMNQKILTNDDNYCTVINKTIKNYKKNAMESKQKFENIRTGDK